MSTDEFVWMGMGFRHKQISDIIQAVIIECFRVI